MAEANGEGKDAFLLADGKASSSEKREGYDGPLGPLAFLLDGIFSSRTNFTLILLDERVSTPA